MALLSLSSACATSSAVTKLRSCLSVVMTDLLLVPACTLAGSPANRGVLVLLLAYGLKQVPAGDSA